jgi:hypothetical protein
MFDGGQRHVADPCVFIEEAAGVRVVKYHRNQVTGPAKIQFDAPDPGIDRRVKRRQGIFESAVVIVLTAVGDDAAGSEKTSRGCRSGPPTEDPIDQAVENPFDPFFHPCFSIQVMIHDGIKKAFACAMVWVIGTVFFN